MLDVRTPAEYAEGHIPGTHFNIDVLEGSYAEIALYCRSGNRSKNAAWLSRDTLHSVKWLPADEGILEMIENLIS